MAEVNANALTTKTTPASTDSMLLFGTTSNEGSKITYDNLADAILNKLTTKTFANQVGGSSAATILSQLATLNTNTLYDHSPLVRLNPSTEESSIQTASAVMKYLGKTHTKINYLRLNRFGGGGNSGLFGTSSFCVLSAFTSTNYGMALCWSDGGVGFVSLQLQLNTVYINTPTMTTTTETIS